MLMVVLCEVYAFSRTAAKYQIEDRRPRATITTEPEGGFQPSWDQVNEILDALREYSIAG